MADDTLPVTKVCSKCGETKPHTLDFFRPMNGGPKLRSTCRKCQGLREGASRKIHFPSELVPDVEAHRAQLKAARVARQVAVRTARYRTDEAYRAAANAAARESRRANPERTKQWDRNNARKNKAPGSDYQKRRYAAADKAEKRAAHKAWCLANPEKVAAAWSRTYEKNKAAINARTMRWCRENPEAVAASRDRRRARDAGAVGSYTREDVRELLKAQRRRCFYCSTALTKFHVDHFIPLSRGGSNYPENLRLSCASCNCSKGAKMPWEWMPDRFRCDEAA